MSSQQTHVRRGAGQRSSVSGKDAEDDPLHDYATAWDDGSLTAAGDHGDGYAPAASSTEALLTTGGTQPLPFTLAGADHDAGHEAKLECAFGIGDGMKQHDPGGPMKGVSAPGGPEDAQGEPGAVEAGDAPFPLRPSPRMVPESGTHSMSAYLSRPPSAADGAVVASESTAVSPAAGQIPVPRVSRELPGSPGESRRSSLLASVRRRLSALASPLSPTSPAGSPASFGGATSSPSWLHWWLDPAGLVASIPRALAAHAEQALVTTIFGPPIDNNLFVSTSGQPPPPLSPGGTTAGSSASTPGCSVYQLAAWLRYQAKFSQAYTANMTASQVPAGVAPPCTPADRTDRRTESAGSAHDSGAPDTGADADAEDSSTSQDRPRDGADTTTASDGADSGDTDTLTDGGGPTSVCVCAPLHVRLYRQVRFTTDTGASVDEGRMGHDSRRHDIRRLEVVYDCAAPKVQVQVFFWLPSSSTVPAMRSTSAVRARSLVVPSSLSAPVFSSGLGGPTNEEGMVVPLGEPRVWAGRTFGAPATVDVDLGIVRTRRLEQSTSEEVHGSGRPSAQPLSGLGYVIAEDEESRGELTARAQGLAVPTFVLSSADEAEDHTGRTGRVSVSLLNSSNEHIESSGDSDLADAQDHGRELKLERDTDDSVVQVAIVLVALDEVGVSLRPYNSQITYVDLLTRSSDGTARPAATTAAAGSTTASFQVPGEADVESAAAWLGDGQHHGTVGGGSSDQPCSSSMRDNWTATIVRQEAVLNDQGLRLTLHALYGMERRRPTWRAPNTTLKTGSGNEQKEENGEEEEGVCPICYTDLAYTLLLPCTHSLCVDCARQLRQATRKENVRVLDSRLPPHKKKWVKYLCPVCRARRFLCCSPVLLPPELCHEMSGH